MEKPVKETLTIEFKSDRKCLPLDDLYKEPWQTRMAACFSWAWKTTAM